MTRRPLRILHTESSTGWGGQEIRILSEARGMIDRGHRLELLTPADGKLFAAARAVGIPTHALPIHRKRLPDWNALRRWCAAHVAQFDVVNTHSSTDSWLTALVACANRNVPPLVRTRHVSTPVNNSPTTRWLYQRATAHIVTAGEALRRQLHRDNGIALDRITSVPTGIDLDRFRPLDRRACRRQLNIPDRPTIGILATLRDWKGHDALLDAFVGLHARHPDWQLVIVGDGPQRARLEARVDVLRLRGAIHFTGNRDDVPEWLATFDLFTLPSWGDEGVPQGITQAMACGLPVVSTTVGAIDEAVVDGVTGVLLAPRDAAALAGAIERLLVAPPLCARMGAAGRERARQRFGIDTMLDAMEGIFERHARRR